MAAPTSDNYVFLPWTRQGAASGIQAPDTLGENQAGVISVTVSLRINNADAASRQVRLYGPGDVTSIDPQQIVRTEPRDRATDFEPNYFPAVEFDRPDFPWLFTPAQADATGRLRPWLCLVVVQKQDGVTLQINKTSAGLPVLDIAPPARPGRELPDLSESWAWAHSQVTGSARNAESIKSALAGDPALTVSRLLCPRRLDPSTEYLACLVPAFDLGCKAGLGQPIAPGDEQKLQPAWASGAESPAKLSLPVYYHWEFRTGVGGDFEALVRALEPRKMPDETGRRLVDISQPGFQITPPLPPGTVLELEGALCVLDSSEVPWSQQTRGPFQSALRAILNAPWQATLEPGHEPLLAPPIYGCWQAAQHTVDLIPAPPAQPPSTPWLHELNLDPRHRAVAALGTRAVQVQQEQLVAAAWEQLGEIQRINQLRRQAQLARAVNATYVSKHFARFDDDTLLKVVAAAQSRVVVAATEPTNVRTRMMLSQRIARSAIPDRAISAPLRRLASPRGAISARFRRVGTPPIAIVSRLNTPTPIVPLQKPDGGWVNLNQVADRSTPFGRQLRDFWRFEGINPALDATPPLGDFTVVPEGAQRSLLNFTPGQPNNADAVAFVNAVRAHQTYLVQQAFLQILIFPAPTLDFNSTRAALVQGLNPEQTITARVQASLNTAAAIAPGGDPLEPILDGPVFPQPMYEAVRDLSQDFLFPGIEHVPPNTVTLLRTNARFVESYLVGLNSQLGSELLWRNYPTDQRGTYFRQFWDAAQPDVKRIKEWGDRALGENAVAGDQLVLLLRGELLRRYPNSVIYAVAAVSTEGQLDLSKNPADERHPLFRGTLKPDVTFLGFNLKREDAIADPGWFFVIQQQPTEPCFGLDVADFGKPLPVLKSWNDLSWRHFAGTPAELQALSHLSVKTTLRVLDNVTWGRNGAHQAYITLQRPVRIAIHARDMIPR
jgi:hypothetical protein